jgi:hypothetical protein
MAAEVVPTGQTAAGQTAAGQTAAGQTATAQTAAGYLADVSELLWPPAGLPGLPGLPGQAETAQVRMPPGQLLVLPNAERPKLIVPVGRRASSAAIRRYGEPGSMKTRLATRALAVMLAGGLGGVLGDRLHLDVPANGETIDSYLESALGRPVTISMHIGAARANRKPVLQLLTPAGETVGFAKIGINPLTASLVRAEQATLRSLAGHDLTLMRLPEVLAAGQWNGLEVMVLSPLPVWLKRRPLAPGQLPAALAELSAVAGTTSEPLAGSPYAQRLTARISQADATLDRDRLAELAGRLTAAARAGSASLSFGSWHGDLTPWNLANTTAGLLVWDWERFTTGVPAGFDMLHYWLQNAVRRPSEDPALAARRCVALAPELLEPFGMPEAPARLTALAYLADLSARYLEDRQEEAGARLGAPGRWLLPALESGLQEV